MIDGRAEALKYGSMRHSKFHQIARKYTESYESGRTWSRKIKSPLTQRKYQIALYKYCKEVRKNPDELIRFKVQGMAYGVSGDPEKMMKMRQAEKLLEDTLAKMRKGQLMIKHAVISFYRKNGFPLISNVAEEWNEANGGERVDLGEDIEIKEKLAKKLHWRKAEKPLIRVLLRNGNIILYKDDYYHYMMDLEQSKEYGDYEKMIKRK